MASPRGSLPGTFRFDPAKASLRLDPQDPQFVQNPYPVYAFLHEHGPVFYWEDYDLWCCSSYNTVNNLLRDRRLGRENRWGPPRHNISDRRHLEAFDEVERYSLLELEPPDHTRLRGLVNRAFVTRSVEQIRPMVRKTIEEAIDRLVPEGKGDLIAGFASPVPVAVIASILGVPLEMAPRLLEWSHSMVAMYRHDCDRSAADRANTASSQFRDYLLELVEERRVNLGDDLLSHLLKAQFQDDRLTDAEIVSTVILLLNAGHEATVHVLGNALYALLREKSRFGLRHGENTGFWEKVTEECLRFDPPLHLFTRFAYAETDLEGRATLQPGQKVGLLLAAANRDPSAFANPNSFDPWRNDQKNLSFGAGIHFCIGAPLARLELAIGLRAAFSQLREIVLLKEPEYAAIYHFRGLESLECRWKT